MNIHLSQLKHNLLVFFLFSTISVFSQNLIPNPGFEDVNICCEMQKPCAPEAWRKSDLSEQTYTIGGLKAKPHSGIAYEKVLIKNLDSKTGMRTFLEVPVLCPLVVGQEYTFSMYVSAEDYRFSQIGVLFTDQFYCNSSNQIKSMTPILTFSMKRKKNWVKLSSTYLATGNEKYLVIGNFTSDRKTRTKKVKAPYPASRTYRLAYCLVDNVSLVPNDPSNTCDYRLYLDTVYQENHRHSCDENNYNCGGMNSVKVDILPKEPTYNPKDFKTIQNINFGIDDTIPMFRNYTEIDKIFAYLEFDPSLKIKIIGHTDNTGSVEHNAILSYKRARVVGDYLIRKGINKERIFVAGYGSKFPLSGNDDNRDRTKNRRIEYQFIKD